MKDVHKWSKAKKIIVVFDCLICLSIIISAMLIVIDKSRIKNGVIYDGKDVSAASVTTQAENTKKGSTSARLMCAGDNLIHRSIYTQAKNRSIDGTYDFSYVYKDVKDIISLSDIAFLNQETIIDTENEPSTYPLFNSPSDLLDEMIDVGFDVYNQATNHCMDKTLSGALNDISLFESKKDILLTGLYRTKDDMLKPQTKTINDITFSFVGFSEYLNGLKVPSGSDLGLLYLTDTRSTQDELYSTMKKMIENAKGKSDVVCVSMHWETEDITIPDESQQAILQKLLDYGADIIIGTGPHVLQPIEYRQNGDGEQALVIWSLGNFVSCQNKKNNVLGGIADVVVKKDYATGKTSVESAKLIPTITQYESQFSNVRIIPFNKYTDSLARQHGMKSANFSYEYAKQFYTDMFGDKLEINYN